MFKMLLARAREARAAELGEESGLEGGFTLIELMVVLLIMAILLAIAIPTFLGVSGGARDRAAQSNLTTALTDSIAFYQNSQTYDATSTSTATSQGAESAAGSTAGALEAQEPSFKWTNGACSSSTNNCISVAPVDVAAVNDGQGIILATYSANGNTCWYVMNLQGTPVAAPTGGATATNYNGSQGAVPSGVSAGTFYAKKTATTCTATDAQAFANWGSSYSQAGTS